MEAIRDWHSPCGKFNVKLFDTFTHDSLGKCRLAYEFYEKGELIFKGSDFCCSPQFAIDSDSCVGALLGFLSLRPGDTDAEYFKDYTERQMTFAEECGEDLTIYSYELENEE